MAKLSKKIISILVNKAIVGFQIPMMSIPPLYKALEDAVAEGKSSEELKAIVAAYPGVKASV